MKIRLVIISISLFCCSIYGVSTPKNTNISSYPYISGYTLMEFCDFVVHKCELKFSPADVKDGDIVFVSNKVNVLSFFFKNIHPKINAKYIIVSHEGICPEVAIFKKYLDEDKIVAWFAKNMVIKHQKAFPIPVGIANNDLPFGNIKILNQVISILPVKKDILLYLNFVVDRKSYCKKVRQKVYNLFSNKKFCYVSKDKPFKEYLYEMARSKFVLSPIGNGIDCYRTWEAMLVGAIPIIDSTALNNLFKDLPVIIVEDWETITEDFLNQKYEEIKSKKYNMEKIYADYWFNKLLNLKNKVKNGC